MSDAMVQGSGGEGGGILNRGAAKAGGKVMQKMTFRL